MKRQRPPRPVWLRLAALLLIPLVGMASAIVPLVLRAERTARAAAELARQTTDLERFIELEAAIAREHLSTGALVRITAMGIPMAAAATILGFDPKQRVEPDRREVAAAAARVTGAFAADVPTVLARVMEIRAVADTSGVDVDGLQAEYDRFRNELMDRIDQVVARLTVSDAVQTAGGNRPIAELGAVMTISRAGVEDVSALSAVLLSPPTARTAAHARLIRSIATQTHAVSSLSAVSAEWRRRLDALRSDARFVDFVQALESSAATTDAPGVAAATTTKVLGAGGAYSAAMTELATTATSLTTSWAKRRAQAASRDLLRLMAQAAATLVATALLAAGSARLISRHLGRLAAKAEHLSEGRLDEAAGPPSGPREIATVGRALNDAVANLRHIEAQAVALSAGRLDDPSLERAAPGKLGALVYDSVGHLASVWRDREQLRERLEHEATHDRLTGLANRGVALDALRGALGADFPVAVLFLDLDGFKAINDSYGHLFGDEVLRRAASALSEAVRRGDVLARLGGDEFMVIAAGVDSAEVALRLGERMREAVAAITAVDGRAVVLGASIGVAMAPEHGRDETALIGRADEAVYAAKRSGRGSVVLHGVAT